MESTINAAVIGFGLSGKVFHAPFLKVHKGFRIHTILTSGHEAGKAYPEARITRNYEQVIADPEIDLVIVCSPNEFHYYQAKRALEAGKHVILEKPVTPTHQEALDLMITSSQHEKIIFPYQNRRWDGDFLTIKNLINEGKLGRVHNFISHFDRYVPQIGRASWRYMGDHAGGTLYDLGVHMIDQAIDLFGKPEALFCQLYNQREGSITDDAFDLKLIYSDLNVTLKAGVLVKDPGPRFIIHGTTGSFRKTGLDPQEGELRNGHSPDEDGFGTEKAEFHGWMITENEGETERIRIETLPGYYMGFYNDVYDCIINNSIPQVSINEAAYNIKIIEAAKESAAEIKVVML